MSYATFEKILEKILANSKSVLIFVSLKAIKHNIKNKQMTTLTALTPELTKRVNSEIVNTQRMINKELAYSKDLQHADRIAELEAHIVKLNGMIANGWNAPKFN